MIKANVIRPVFIVCPQCGKSEHGVQHLYDTSKERGKEVSFGPWHCKLCRYEFRGTVLYAPSSVYDPCVVTITDIGPCKDKPKLSLLRLRDLYAVVDGYGDYQPEEKDRLWYDFLFHSHQCPTNIMKDVIEVFDEEGRDPHGIFRFIAALEDTKENRVALDEAGTREQLLTLFQTDGKEAPSDWPEKNKGVIPWLAALRRGEYLGDARNLEVVCSSSEEEAAQGIVKFEILSKVPEAEARKKVIEYVEQALKGIIGKEPT